MPLEAYKLILFDLFAIFVLLWMVDPLFFFEGFMVGRSTLVLFIPLS